MVRNVLTKIVIQNRNRTDIFRFGLEWFWTDWFSLEISRPLEFISVHDYTQNWTNLNCRHSYFMIQFDLVSMIWFVIFSLIESIRTVTTPSLISYIIIFLSFHIFFKQKLLKFIWINLKFDGFLKRWNKNLILTTKIIELVFKMIPHGRELKRGKWVKMDVMLHARS